MDFHSGPSPESHRRPRRVASAPFVRGLELHGARRAVILKGELLIVSNRAEPSHTGLMYCTVHFSRNGMSHLFTTLCKWIQFYLGATYAGQSAAPLCNLRILESAYPPPPPPLSPPVPPAPARGPIVLAAPNESHVGTAVHTKTRELALRVSLISLPSHSTRCTPILLP